MPVFNAAQTVGVAVRSVLSQSHDNWELIVIDDGSTDGTLLRMREFVDPRIRLIAGEANLGLAARLNQAIEVSAGRYLARMDADDVAYPERLEAQVKFMESHPECDLVGAAVLIFDDTGAARGRFPVRTAHDAICARPWSGFPLPHPTWFGKRSWFLRIGYLPDYRKTQDQDALLRAYRSSRFACLPQLLLGYRQQRRTVKKMLAGRWYFSRSILREARLQGALWAGFLGLSGQCVKALADVATVPLELDRRLRGESRLDLAPAEALEWDRIWNAVDLESSSK